MNTLNINCDMGEGIGNDALIMPYINSANIALGYHAGDEVSIRQTMELCIKYDVHAGAHPSYYDKINFGRTEKKLSPDEIYELIKDQLIIFTDIAQHYNLSLHHVKPHGALYNQSAKDPKIAATIARAVYNFDPGLILVGLSGSHSISEAKNVGLRTLSEVFADRTYQDDGSLTPRIHANALIENLDEVVRQVSEMIIEGMVTTISGKKISIVAETVCIHGDGPYAVEFAKALRIIF